MNYDNMRNMLDDVQTLLEFGDPQAQQPAGDDARLKHTLMTLRTLQDAAVQAFPGNQPKPIDQAKVAKYIQMALGGQATVPLKIYLAGAPDTNPKKVAVVCNIVSDENEGFALRVFANKQPVGKFMCDDFAEYSMEDFVGFMNKAVRGANPNPTLPGQGQISFGAGLD